MIHLPFLNEILRKVNKESFEISFWQSRCVSVSVSVLARDLPRCLPTFSGNVCPIALCGCVGWAVAVQRRSVRRPRAVSSLRRLSGACIRNVTRSESLTFTHYLGRAFSATAERLRALSRSGRLVMGKRRYEEMEPDMRDKDAIFTSHDRSLGRLVGGPTSLPDGTDDDPCIYTLVVHEDDRDLVLYL